MSLFERQMGHVGRYRIIAADPPWAHDNYGQAKHGAAKSAYDEMPLEDLERMPVGELAHPAGALLLLWCTGPQAADGAAQRLAKAWGFELRTRLFAWVKVNDRCDLCGCSWSAHRLDAGADLPAHCQGCADPDALATCSRFAPTAFFGPGSYTGQNVEDVWLGVRDGATAWSSTRARRDVRQVLFAPASRNHSEKPERMQDRVEALWPHVAPSERLELFARRRRPGWACWGGQCPEPDLVFGDPPGAWWPLEPRHAPAAAAPEQLTLALGAPEAP